MSTTLVSCVKNVRDTETQHYGAGEIIESMRTDKPLKLRPLTLASTIEGIRKTFADTLAQTRDRKAGKNAVNEAKKQLPAILFSGSFSQRRSSCLLQHSGFLCADLDDLGEQLPEVWEKLKSSPHLWAMFRSPTGDGLKCVFRVRADAAKHKQSFRAVEEHVHALAGTQVDQACSDVARLCFFSYDPETFVNEAAIELQPLDIEKPASPTATTLCAPEIKTRRDIAEEMLGKIDWQTDTRGNCICPGEHLHQTPTQEGHCQVLVDSAPTIHCFHSHCKSILKGVNHELRSRIGKAEHAAKLQMQNAANNQSKIMHAHYDSGKKCYWTQNSRGGWIEINEQSLRRILKDSGFNATPTQGQSLSQVDQKLIEIQLQQDVAYAGPLAGYQRGVLECYGNRILVTTSPKLIEPKAGDWPVLNQFLQNLLIDGAYDQRPYVFAWLRLAYEALRAGHRRPGPVMGLAGPRNSGKSLLQNLFTVILGGRVAKPYRYMSGHTDFNGELFSAEHLMIEDEAPSTDLRSRRALGAHIKAFTVNETQSCHVKNRQALTLSPFWRVSISVNDEPENLMILPPISDSEYDSLGDKIILL
ncbi:MAG: BT4734/BF3469 family protein, partial [Chthoniobacterales bacterium]